MSDLFADAAEQRSAGYAPLALRLRPSTLEEFVGQEHVLAEGSALRRAISEDRVGSAIFFGPPGSGKTTLARIVAASTGAAFEELSAVSATVSDVRGVLARARERLGAQGQRTILFLDEIHRFNKAQQDALLPAVEEGLVTLIGATTENPYFEVNSALLSRVQLYELLPLELADLEQVVARGEAALDVQLEPDVRALVARRAGGDARNALNILEAAVAAAQGEPVIEEHVEDWVDSPFAGDFVLRVTGDSMVDAGILDRDYVVVRQQPDADPGDTVVAGIPGEEATVKTYLRRRGKIVLRPENATMDEMVFDPGEVVIYGKVVSLLRRL